jgi:23S rRNA pseudouridine2605 synthase
VASEAEPCPAPDVGERLHKLLADAGLGSRREMEEWIEQGKVSVNGQRAVLGQRAVPTDVIRVAGKRVYLRPERRVRVVLYHKPDGEIVSRDDPEGRATVFTQLPRIKGGRWISVGRLDINSEGLMIFTTSGELANRLMHPSFELEREYAARVMGELQPEHFKRLLEGVELDDGMAQFEMVVPTGGEGSNRWYKVVIREGRKREVRRLFEAVGFMVSRLMRVRFGPVALPPRLKRGQVLELDDAEVARLLGWAGLEKPRPQAPAAGRAGARSATAKRPRGR